MTTPKAETDMVTRHKLVALRIEVARYLDKPGCNVPQRQKAMERLRWALEQATDGE